MDEYESLSHSKWECKYHVTLTEGRRALYANCGSIWERCSTFGEQKESRVEEGI